MPSTAHSHTYKWGKNGLEGQYVLHNLMKYLFVYHDVMSSALLLLRVGHCNVQHIMVYIVFNKFYICKDIASQILILVPCKSLQAQSNWRQVVNHRSIYE